MNKEKKIVGILNAIELYAEAGRKGEGKLIGQAFIPEATMTWVADGKISAVPIAALADALDKTGAEEVTYEVSDITLAQDECLPNQRAFTLATCFGVKFNGVENAYNLFSLFIFYPFLIVCSCLTFKIYTYLQKIAISEKIFST